MQDMFDDLVKRYNGPKLAFVVTGGGIGISQLAQTLGASRILSVIHVPYDYEQSVKFITDTNQLKDSSYGKQYCDKAVSEGGARLLCMAGMFHWPTCKVIACSAATTTNRYRRGNNEAFICVGNPGVSVWPVDRTEDYYLKLTKSTEEDYKLMGHGYATWKRRSEDSEITKFLLKLALGEHK